ncbi:hypothetical protein [Roseomonas sp. BN140053]|uniref:hypothetical protein n=1 Tax=Roseomonas sp. BN140053 TaxID=3391898 RepID=UPI0039EC57F8
MSGTDALPLEDLAGGPQVGIRAPVGIGKTRALAERIRDVLARDPAARVAFVVPDHRLAAEAQARLAAELGSAATVATWPGQDQPDPNVPGERMCRRPAEARAVQRVGGELSTLCGGPRVGMCPFHPDNPAGTAACGYRAQGTAARAARVVVLATANLSRAAPKALRRRETDAAGVVRELPPFDLVVLDEAFWPALLGGFGPEPVAVSLADLEPALWAGVPARGSEPAGWAAGHVQAALGALAKAVGASTPGDGLSKAALQAAGLRSPGECSTAREYVWRCKQDVAGTVGRLLQPQDDAALSQTLAPLADTNRRVLAVARLLDIAGDILAGRIGPAALRAGTRQGQPALFLRWREDIHQHWLAAPLGIVHADATMQPDIVRCWLPDLVVAPTPAAPAPHMRVVQVEDRQVGYGSLLEARNRSQDGQRAARNNTARVLRVLERMGRVFRGQGAAGGPDVLAVLPKALEDALRGKLPANVGTLHFNALRGQDAFRGAAGALIVSRPMPGVADVEDRAEVIFGREVQRLPSGVFFPKVAGARRMADGTFRGAVAHRHPDPDAEAVRWATCEAELVQAVGRVRGVRRTANNPVEVWLTTSTPLDDVAVAEAIPLREAWERWGGLDPATALLEAGVVPAGWRGRGAVLEKAGFFPGAADKGEACRDWFRRDKTAAGRLGAGLSERPGCPPVLSGDGAPGTKRTSSGKTSIKMSIEENPEVARAHPAATEGSNPGPSAALRWAAFTYRAAGSRQRDTVHVAAWHPDPRAAVEAQIGPLDLFAPAAQAPASLVCARRQRRPARAVTPASGPTPAALLPDPLLALPAPPRLLALPAPPAPAAVPALAMATAGEEPPTASPPAPARLPVRDRQVRLPDVIRAAGLDMAGLRSFMLRGEARDLERELANRGVRLELRRAAAARVWIGPAEFDAALSRVASGASDRLAA